METCLVCTKKVYPTERVAADKTIYHKSCFRCETCKSVLKLGSYASMEGRVFCKPCFKKNFFTKGNYSEGFGKLKPQQEHDLKSGKTVEAVEESASAFDVEKKKQEEEEKRRREELKRRVEEDRKNDRPKELEKKESSDDEKGAKKSDDFMKKQEAFQREREQEKEREAKRKEEERLKLFEEARLRRETEKVEKPSSNDKSPAEKERERRAEIRNSVKSTSNFFLSKDQENKPTSNFTKSTVSTTSTSKQDNIFLKKDQENKVQITNGHATLKRVASVEDPKTAKIKVLEHDLSESKDTIAQLKKLIEEKDQEIQKLTEQNKDLESKLQVKSVNDNNSESRYKELDERDEEIAAN